MKRRKLRAGGALWAVMLALWAIAACDSGSGPEDGPDAAELAADAEPDEPAEPAEPADAALPDAEPEPDAAPPPYEPPPVEGAPVLEDTNPDPDIVEVELRAELGRVELFDGIGFDAMLYNGVFPGPLLQAEVGDEVIVHFTNALDEPTTVHWHGLRIDDEMDGNPRIQSPVQPGETFTYRFTPPDAGTYWYHPHVRSHMQVERGLYGAIVIHDPADPEFDAERVVVLDDILIDQNGLPPFLASHPEVMHGRHGNVLLQNGSVDPIAARADRGTVERWRIVNTANARTMNISLSGASGRLVATDGGRLPEPVNFNRLQVAVGQRYDIEVHLDQAGTAALATHVRVVDDTGQAFIERIPVMEVEVDDASEPAESNWRQWADAEPPPVRGIDREETMEFTAINDPVRGLQWTINGEADRSTPLMTFTEGETAHMRLVNRAGPEHPFHMHGQFFEILKVPLASVPIMGLKDTVLVPGLSTVEIRVYMDNPGRWMAHCHILEHAALGMMSEIVVEPAE